VDSTVGDQLSSSPVTMKVKPLDLINDLDLLKIKMRASIIFTLYHAPTISTSPMVIQFNGGILKFPILKSLMAIISSTIHFFCVVNIIIYMFNCSCYGNCIYYQLIVLIISSINKFFLVKFKEPSRN
jgi:hypothetical protein